MLSSFGKLLAVVALIWNKENSNVYLILTKIFVITSNAEAVKGKRDASRDITSGTGRGLGGGTSYENYVLFRSSWFYR